MKLMPSLLVIAAGTGLISSAQALVVAGNTTGQPTFNRPFTIQSMSTVGTAVPHTVLPFTVSAAGGYIFLTTTAGAYDPFIALYTTFNPAAPLNNLLTLNDDLQASSNNSGFTVAMATGTTYRLIVTGYDNADFGPYTTSITGPGAVVAVPEPAAGVLMGLGLAGLLLASRWRSLQSGGRASSSGRGWGSNPSAWGIWGVWGVLGIWGI